MRKSGLFYSTAAIVAAYSVLDVTIQVSAAIKPGSTTSKSIDLNYRTTAAPSSEPKNYTKCNINVAK